MVCCKGGENKKINRLVTVAAVALVAIITAVLIIKLDMSEIVKEILEIFRLDTGDSSGRIDLWKNGWQDFLSSCWFGVGFSQGGNPDGLGFSNVYSNMYHNIFVQMLGAMGSVGIVAFLIHIFSLGREFLKKLKGEKWFIILTPLLILGMSLFDNFFFYPNFQIVYTAFLVCAETMLPKDK